MTKGEYPFFLIFSSSSDDFASAYSLTVAFVQMDTKLYSVIRKLLFRTAGESCSQTNSK